LEIPSRKIDSFFCTFTALIFRRVKGIEPSFPVRLVCEARGGFQPLTSVRRLTPLTFDKSKLMGQGAGRPADFAACCSKTQPPVTMADSAKAYLDQLGRKED
jgi:hypothetical protein